MSINDDSIMLKGSDLLAKTKELKGVSKSETVRACGYVSTKKDGTERLNFTAFYEALLEAKGVSIGDAADGGGNGGARGRGLSYTTTVHKNGSVSIGTRYCQQLGLQPDDVLEIKVRGKSFTLSLLSDQGEADLDAELNQVADDRLADGQPPVPAASIVPDAAPAFGVPVAA